MSIQLRVLQLTTASVFLATVLSGHVVFQESPVPAIPMPFLLKMMALPPLGCALYSPGCSFKLTFSNSLNLRAL